MLGLSVARSAPALLVAASGWPELVAREPVAARYVSALLILPLPFVGAILALGLLNFAEVHGLTGPQRGRRWSR
jgi:hypothetical protein